MMRKVPLGSAEHPSGHRPRVKPGATGWGCCRYFELADDIIQIRACDHPMLEFFEMMVVCQLLAMERHPAGRGCGYPEEPGEECDGGVSGLTW